MSIKVMNYVWENSQQKGSSLLLLLAIADHAHDDGTGAYPSIESLANKTRMSVRNTQYALRRLEAAGELSVSLKAGPKDVNVYCIPLPMMVQSLQVQERVVVQTSVEGGANQRQGVVQTSVEGGAMGCTQTVIEPSVLTVIEPSGGERASARKHPPIDDAFLAELQDEHPQINVQREYQKFTLDLQAKGKTWKDYRAAFRKWLLRAEDFSERDDARQTPTGAAKVGGNGTAGAFGTPLRQRLARPYVPPPPPEMCECGVEVSDCRGFRTWEEVQIRSRSLGIEIDEDEHPREEGRCGLCGHMERCHLPAAVMGLGAPTDRFAAGVNRLMAELDPRIVSRLV